MKQIIIVDKSLKMPAGKMAAQVAHAAVCCFMETDAKDQDTWVAQGMPKIVLKTDSKIHLIDVFQKAKELGIPCHLIEDDGRTVFDKPTITCVGIGPAEEKILNPLSEAFKLY